MAIMLSGPDPFPPVVELLSPAPGAIITRPVEIFATAAKRSSQYGIV